MNKSKLKWYQKILQKLHIKKYYYDSYYKFVKEPFKNEKVYCVLGKRKRTKRKKLNEQNII